MGAADCPQGVASVPEEPRMCSFSSSELGITWEHPGVQGVITSGYRHFLAQAPGAQPRLSILQLCLHAARTFPSFPLLYRWFCGDTVHQAALILLCVFHLFFPPWVGVPTCHSSALQPWELLRSGRALLQCCPFYRSLTSTSALVCLLQLTLAARCWVARLLSPQL